MNLKHLTDEQLNKDLKQLVSEERDLLSQILYHLKEVEDRKLFVEYNCTSLFDYACKELKYSPDQACRRIQAMRLIKKVPEVAPKISSGELSLSNINQAQRFFNENKVVKKQDKMEVLKKLENKSVRDGQKEILKLSPEKPLPRETKKQVSPTHTQVNFNMSEGLEKKLENIKTLLGPKAYNMSMAELVETMADLASQKLQENKFGKKRAQVQAVLKSTVTMNAHAKSLSSAQSSSLQKKSTMNTQSQSLNKEQSFGQKTKSAKEKPTINVNGKAKQQELISTSKSPRYISQKLKHHIWLRDQAQCTKCKSKTNLHLDHIVPFAMGGKTETENLRILCFHCNQRQRMTMKLGNRSISRHL